MLKLYRHLKGSYRYIVCIVLLLLLQANCDLALPSYTSNIVNVGIQQQGVENGVPKQIREETLEHLFLFMEEDDIARVKDAYTLGQEGIWELKKLNKSETEELEKLLAVPEMIVSGLSGDSQQAAQMRQQMNLPQEADLFAVFAQIPKEQLLAQMEEQASKLEEMPDTMLTQSAVLFVQQEYEAQGISLDTLQTDYIKSSGIQMLGLAFVTMAAAIAVTFLSCRLAASLGRSLRNEIFGKVISFSSSEMNQFSTASLITRSTNDIQQVQMMTTMMFRIVLYAPILGIGGVIKVLNTEGSMTWILAVAVALIMVVVGVLFKVAMPRFRRLQTLIDRVNLVAREILTGIPVIRAFSREKREEERFEEANQNLTRTNLFVNRCMTFMMPLMMLIMNGITVLIVYTGAHTIDSGTMQVGDMMAFIQYAMQIIMSFLMITMISIMLPRAEVSAKRINQVLDTQVEIENPAICKSPREDKKGELEFRNVSFAYPGAEEKVLENISFTAARGETVAFIGSTGSGKSTLVNLIPRFFDVTEGEILLDGVDIREMDLKDLRRRLGYVPQKGVLFSGTIDSNLRYGCPDAPEEAIRRAAEIAQATEFIEAKPEKYRSPIAQGGSNVSGGQKQRLSIARAIAKNPEVYIFDDSFSALDFKTDVTLRKALKESTGDATTLIVAQRISTIIHADQILVLDEGRVAGKGTHKELLKTCEVYRQIATSQLSEEELDNE
ncbi:MAG TPA: ABC transporter ATP-binding protein [Candidatus Egerieimonas intestinavium]|uniref:ABC transporter ATP-binding protein n=1 Tax=Candidatus Egerieimonas intestinavium TaxID=2840777 RepID=A0A9D1ELG1_9FIRM|nr:ABC transporter ATP-binding protein [Candidatus Egerieimonas intestinavium]